MAFIVFATILVEGNFEHVDTLGWSDGRQNCGVGGRPRWGGTPLFGGEANGEIETQRVGPVLIAFLLINKWEIKNLIRIGNELC